ncbi:MAG: sodium:solute symporter family transporter, partial [Nannocystaceae bacterium]
MAVASGVLDPLDWGIIVAYAVIVVWVGLWVRARGEANRGSDEFLVARRQMPTWVATGSLLATELSAATFLGVPHAAFAGDWSYLQLLVGALLGRIVVATTMIRRYAALNLVTVYGLLGRRIGPRSHRLSAWLFIAGRVLASGVRLFIAALAFSVVTGLSLSLSIVCAGSLAGLYAGFGGIRSVMWTDILQALVFIVAALAALWVGFEVVGLDFGHLLALGETAGKLDILKIGTPIVAF